jgi:ribonuclease Z
MYGLTILGNNSALPAYDRHPTAQALHWGDQIFLIDCGEGTQMQLSRYKIRRSRIQHIFISHLHGDHYFGLVGLITSMGLMGRDTPLHVYGPQGLEAIIQLQLSAADTRLPYPLHFHGITESGLLLDEKTVTVHCFAVKHRITCFGFFFAEKKAPRKLNKDAAIAAGIPHIFYQRLQWGEDYVAKTGEVIANESVTFAANPPLSYAYCADTLFDPSLCQHIQNASLLYHEATFLEAMKDKAAERFHATARQAATIASLSGARKLLVGHFSSRYESLVPFLEEASAVFEPTDLAIEGVTYLIRH